MGNLMFYTSISLQPVRRIIITLQWLITHSCLVLESSWNVMAHGDIREGKWRGNWRMKWVASTLHTTSESGVSSITTADAYTSTASSWLNWRPRRFKRTRPFPRKTKSGFCACAITFQLASTACNVVNVFWNYGEESRLNFLNLPWKRSQMIHGKRRSPPTRQHGATPH